MMKSVSINGEKHVIGSEDEWIIIQNRTFVNWVNQQLTTCGRQVSNLETDFCDGVNLVALVESLQFRKIGKVYTKCKSRIQMIQNVNLAFKAITEDNIRLVNIGNEDVVNGNIKLILGLLWHLILRYQISSSKTKAPPKKLMMAWFTSVLPELKITNFSSDWSDGIALNALLEMCRPGSSPNWKQLHSKNRVENCRLAMTLAKDLLNIPIMISPEDFASSALDEMSAMTYLSYFIKKDSPGYYATLNWVCRQLRTTTVSNLSTDWNDGYYLCGIVQSVGGNIPGWPDLDRNDYIANCRLGMETAKAMGIDPILTPEEMADPSVDHLTIMAYLSKFKSYQPIQEDKKEKIILICDIIKALQDEQVKFKVELPDSTLDKLKLKVEVKSKNHVVTCNAAWKDNRGEYLFTPRETGKHTIHVYFDNEEMSWSPDEFEVEADLAKVKISSDDIYCKVDGQWQVKIDVSRAKDTSISIISTNPVGKSEDVPVVKTNDVIIGSIRPRIVGKWTVTTYMNGHKSSDELFFNVFNPNFCSLTGPDYLLVGEKATFTVDSTEAGSDEVDLQVYNKQDRPLGDFETNTIGHHTELTFCPKIAGRYKVAGEMYEENISGSPVYIEVHDTSQVIPSGDGLFKAAKGEKATFTVNTNRIKGNLSVSIKVNNEDVKVKESRLFEGYYEYEYIPFKPGQYVINLSFSGLRVKGSPYYVQVSDQSSITMITDLSNLKDENDFLVLDYKTDTKLVFNIANAGPGNLRSEILSPSGKRAAKVEQGADTAKVTFQAEQKGDHYIHIYWNESPLAVSPILAYCDGPVLPIDHSKVVLRGEGCKRARKGVMAEFIVDGRLAGPGKCRVILKGVNNTVDVNVKDIKYNRYRCTYTSHITGGFLLYVYWSNELLPECPVKLSIGDKGAAAKVSVYGDGLKGGIAGEDVPVYVDAKEAGPGVVTAICSSQHHQAECHVKDEENGEFIIWVRPTEPGKYLLIVQFDGTDVPGSPFVIRIVEPPDASKVRAFGPGIENGLISNYQSRFLVETQGAGAGKLAVRIRGPKAAFKAEMKREGKNDRTILCFYDPSEIGLYTITILWSGEEIPGSPFNVHIFESRDEMFEFEEKSGNYSHVIEDEQWRTEI
ncbi:hypothetical protein SNE40_000352 [Patella caerulea]|uniref:Calponin-homology (CH) domain-containing protein n=2 Tax=Patella caerulea TaxID=87958 RepID=A0AAN8KEE2_PATCE